MFERTRERFERWRLYRETVRQLNWLDPHMLADAGVPRGAIRSRARAAVEQRCD